MKNIIHMKIPMLDDKYNRPDQFAVSPKLCGVFTKRAQEILGDEYAVILSPFDCAAVNPVDSDAKVITIDCKEYSYNELKEIIEKAEERCDECEFREYCDGASCDVHFMPLEDVEPIIHAHWIHIKGITPCCSNCGCCIEEKYIEYKRCPMCGAHMNKEDKPLCQD